MVFSQDKIAGKAVIELELSEYEIEMIMVEAIEFGIGYWATMENTDENWEEKPDDYSSALWATKLLLEGKKILITDEEEAKTYTLTLDKLIKGYGFCFKQKLYEVDAETSDYIIQYALFGKVIYEE